VCIFKASHLTTLGSAPEQARGGGIGGTSGRLSNAMVSGHFPCVILESLRQDPVRSRTAGNLRSRSMRTYETNVCCDTVKCKICQIADL